MPEIEAAARGLIQFGERGDDLMDTLKMLGDAASGTSTQFGFLALVYNQVRGVGRFSDVDGQWLAADFGLSPAGFDDLKGGSVEENLSIADALVKGRGPQGLVDTIVLNAAIGLWSTGKVESVQAGLPLAREALLGGAVRNKISDTKQFFSS
jgi:hypothetical protein